MIKKFTSVIRKTAFQRSRRHGAWGKVGQTRQILRKNKITSSSGKLFKIAKRSTLQNFWDLGRTTLVGFLVVRGLKTSGGKAELVADAFSAVELKLLTIESSEVQQATQ